MLRCLLAATCSFRADRRKLALESGRVGFRIARRVFSICVVRLFRCVLLFCESQLRPVTLWTASEDEYLHPGHKAPLVHPVCAPDNRVCMRLVPMHVGDLVFRRIRALSRRECECRRIVECPLPLFSAECASPLFASTGRIARRSTVRTPNRRKLWARYSLA